MAASALDYYIQDDFGDNALTGRTGGEEGVYPHPYNVTEGGTWLKARDRPEWDTDSGSPAAANSQLEFPAGDTTQQRIRTPTDFTIGSWKFDFQYVSAPGTGYIVLAPITDLISGDPVRNGDGYDVRPQDGGSLQFYREDAGSGTTLITSSWADDTAQHEIELTRDPYGGWELFFDSVSEGTTTDDTYTTTNYLFLHNESDVQVNVDNLDVGPVSGVTAPDLNPGSPLGFALNDDFGDNALTGRSSVQTGYYFTDDPGSGSVAGDMVKAIDRPEWSTESGSPSATNQELQLSAGNSTKQVVRTPSNFFVGSWEVDIQKASDPTTSGGSFSLSDSFTTDSKGRGTDSYWLHASNSTSFSWYKSVGGAYTELISGSWADDTAVHTVKVTRDSYGSFELFEGGASQGTAADITYTTTNMFHIGNASDVQYNFDNLVVV